MYVYYVHERGKAARLVSIESSFGKRRAACLRRCRTFYLRKMRMWYNKHNTKVEKRDRFPVMCLLNRSEASRFAACTYGIISTERLAVQAFGRCPIALKREL